MSRSKLIDIVNKNKQLASQGAPRTPVASTARPVVAPLVPVDYSELEARMAAAETHQAGRTALREVALDRAEYQATTERKLRLVPGAIHRQASADRKVVKTEALTSAAFEGVMPSVLRALRMGGLSDVQIAAIVLEQRTG